MSGAGVEVRMKDVAEALRLVAETDVAGRTGGELEALALLSHEVQSLATAVHTKVMAAFDASRVWEVEGARSAAAWLSWKRLAPMSRCRATVRCGRELRRMPVTEAAFLGGRLTPEHVRLLAHARSVAPEAFERDEAELVRMAEALLFRQLEVAFRYWCYRNEPDGDEERARRRYLGRQVHCSKTFEGNVVIDGQLEPVGGEMFAGELRRLEQELFDADWAELRERDGDASSVLDLTRTAAQRRADALVEMARRSAARPDGAVAARPLITVLVGEETLARLCELSDGTVVTPGEVLPLLRDCDLERILFGGPSRVLDVGVRQRCFVGATRRAVEVRDRCCTHPSCTEPADRCQVDHLQEYGDDGPTMQSNGDLKCPFHHRWRHRRVGPDA